MFVKPWAVVMVAAVMAVSCTSEQPTPTVPAQQHGRIPHDLYLVPHPYVSDCSLCRPVPHMAVDASQFTPMPRGIVFIGQARSGL